MIADAKDKLKNEAIKKVILWALPLLLGVLGIFILVVIAVVIFSPSEFIDFGAIENLLTNLGKGRGITFSISIDLDSDQGKFYTRVVDNAVAAREENDVSINAGIIGATYYYINYYYNDFEYNDMTDEVINDLIYNMASSQTTFRCREKLVSNPIDIPEEIDRCYQILLTDYDPEGNLASPAEITACRAIIENYERTKTNEEDPDERTLTFKEGETPSCPPNYTVVDSKISYSLDLSKYYNYLERIFIPTVAPELEEEKILEIIEQLKTVEERFFESEGVPEYILNIDVGYVPPNVVEEFSSPFKVPYKITSWFGLRLHPTKGTYHFHSGIDISGSNKYGTLNKKPIYAPVSGVVATVGRDKSCGNKVILRHTIKGKVYETVYCHLYEIHVSVGSESNPKYIEKGEPIGLVGTTGDSTGPHLHWGVWEGRYGRGIRLDPFEFIKNDPNCYYGNSNNPTPCSSK